MKNITTIVTMFFLGAALVITPSCKKVTNFLDQAPGVSINEDVLFSSKIQLDQFLATVYKNAMPTIYNYQDATQTTTFNLSDNTTPAQGTESITEEGDASEQTFIQTNIWNSGGVTAQNIVTSEDRRYYQRWIALREIALMLKRVDEVPDADAAYKKQVKAEVKVLRALNYLEMVKRYGGVPIVNQVFDAGVNINSIVPRATIEDTFKFIVQDCDDAYNTIELPLSYSASLTGRITKLAALAVKAKALLYAASPLFNTGTPYLDFGANNKLICYGNFDNNRWKLAADAAKAVLDAAPASNVTLVDDPTKRMPATPAVGSVNPVVGNYTNSWEQLNNSEIILSFQGYPAIFASNAPLKFIYPLFAGAGWSGVTVPLNFFSQYEKLDGTPQTWSSAGGPDLISKYYELDPRFKQTMCYTNSYWNPQYTIVPIYAGGGTAYNLCFGGMWMHKMAPRTSSISVRADVLDITLSLHEFYLDYAEAQNELAGPGIDHVTGNLPTVPATSTNPAGIDYSNSTCQIPTIGSPYDAVDKIRLRSGMPPLPTGLSQSQFRDRVRHERTIELAYEEHHFWDIKRWMIAETPGVMTGAMQGIKITQNGSLFSWLPYTFENRVWLRQEYLHPFPLPEVLKGGLIQNPGW